MSRMRHCATTLAEITVTRFTLRFISLRRRWVLSLAVPSRRLKAVEGVFDLGADAQNAFQEIVRRNASLTGILESRSDDDKDSMLRKVHFAGTFLSS